jgi:hypothetical protein
MQLAALARRHMIRPISRLSSHICTMAGLTNTHMYSPFVPLNCQLGQATVMTLKKEGMRAHT